MPNQRTREMKPSERIKEIRQQTRDGQTHTDSWLNAILDYLDETADPDTDFKNYSKGYQSGMDFMENWAKKVTEKPKEGCVCEKNRKQGTRYRCLTHGDMQSI